MEKCLLLATGNPKKRKEMEELAAGMGWEIKTLREFPDCAEAVEDGDTFIENARKKALHYAPYTKLLTLADDSGFEVDALDGRPGVYSSRYARGEGSTDQENLEKVLMEMGEVPDPQRAARFVCVAVLATAEGAILHETRQTVEGMVAHEPRGEGGFGYDPIFYYPPFKKTFAEVPAEDKHAVSHRGKAMREIVRFLSQWEE
ncbi:RdgB/HAM1 family non-canonical purine NTP pyrophosphatase [bacterium]|nr:RdgB/HAM1 family non-canonical purine NTP pyrophosphatase [bacterium]